MKFLIPSREDAEPLTSHEKRDMLFFVNGVSVMQDTNDRMQHRMSMVQDGPERIKKLAEDSLKLLEDIRETIPEKQRRNLYNMGVDMEMRMVPKYTPTTMSVLVPQEDFKELVDAAQAKCADCTLDQDECQEKCELFKLFVTILPLSEYKASFLCPYNLATWGVGNEK